jgi:NitT/TauT family transport system substrate-binding protein
VRCAADRPKSQNNGDPVNLIKHFLVQALTLLILLVAFSYATHANSPLMTGVAGPAINLVYAHLTKDAGLWQKHGLDARVVVFESGSILAQAALSGEVKFSISSGPATIASRVQGADTIILAAMVNTLPYSIVAAKNITRWDQLKGKKIAISRFGSGTDTALRMVLKKYGLDPVKDVVILQVGTQPARIQALAAGVIDATIVSPPLDFQAKKQGYQILVNIADLKIPYPQLVVETTERYAKENPQTVKSFLKGFIEGVHYAANHKEETKKIMTKYLRTVDPEILDVTYDNFLETTDYSGRPNLDGIRNAMDEVAARVPAVKSRKPEEFVDTRILRELEKEGFFKQFQKKS